MNIICIVVTYSFLVIGLHPDQATEPIVDCSLYHNLKMAIVPCCVFAHEFPDRKTILEGKEIPVRTYSEFTHYLLQKNLLFQSDYLPLQGRNKIIYNFC